MTGMYCSNRPFQRYGKYRANVTCTYQSLAFHMLSGDRNKWLNDNSSISFSHDHIESKCSHSKLHWKRRFGKYSRLSRSIRGILRKVLLSVLQKIQWWVFFSLLAPSFCVYTFRSLDSFLQGSYGRLFLSSVLSLIVTFVCCSLNFPVFYFSQLWSVRTRLNLTWCNLVRVSITNQFCFSAR